MSNLILNTQYDKHSSISESSIFSTNIPNTPNTPTSDIPDSEILHEYIFTKSNLSKDPNRLSLNSNSTASSNSSVSSFRTIKIRNTKMLKIKIDRGEDYTVLKLRKDKLTSLQDLIEVLYLKIPNMFNKIYIVFERNNLKSLEINSLLSDIIFDYILAKDKILLKLE